jgi:glucose/mannose transport system permease protein
MAQLPLTGEAASLSLNTPQAKRGGLTEQNQSFLFLLPSIIAIFIFVYGFISVTFYISLSNWRSATPDWTVRTPLFETYVDLFTNTRFQIDLRNTLIFTILFITSTVLLGLFLAIVVDFKLRWFSIPFFRNTFLFPYALSFIVTGVAWRWIFNPETGINLFFDLLGINSFLVAQGMEPLKPGWTTDPSVVWSVNNALSSIFPAIGDWRVQLGIPVALIPVAIAAMWQLSGFVMAMYLGGMTTISGEVREAARIDGATEWQVYRHVIIPQLAPVTISVTVILLHVSFKIFDLVFAMAGTGPAFATDVPAIFVFEQMFKGNKYNLGTAAAIIMLVLVALIIVPYLRSQRRGEE